MRLHSAIGFVTPADILAGRQKEILATRDRKLEEARRQRQMRRQQPGMRFKVTMAAAEAGNAGVISTTEGPFQRSGDN